MIHKPANLIYGVDDRPPWLTILVLGFQHTFAMASTLVLVSIIARAVGETRPEAANFIRLAMIAVGIVTVIQAWPLGPVGAGYLCPHLCGPAFFTASLLAAKTGGLSLMWGMTALAGCVQAVLSRFVHRLRALFPAEVTGVVVTMVGISLIPVGIPRFAGTDRASLEPHLPAILTGFIALAPMVCLAVWAKGKLRLYNLLIGVGAGFLAAYVIGRYSGTEILSRDDLQHILDDSWLALPQFSLGKMSFRTALVLPFLIAALCSSLKAVGDLTVCQKINDSDWTRPDMNAIRRGLLADALGVIVAGLLGGMGTSTSSSNVVLSLANGATSRWIAVSAGLLFILFAFVPKLSDIFAIMPDPVGGAIVVFVACYIIVAGFQIITSRMIDSRKIFLVGSAIVFGLSVDFFPELFRDVPPALSPLFSSSLSLATVLAVALNLLFRLGVAQRHTLSLQPGRDSSEKIIAFLETLGSAWGARREVITQAVNSLNEFFESASDAKLAEGAIMVEVFFDEFNLDIDLRYDGVLANFPEAPPSTETLLSSAGGMADMAGFLIRRSVDRLKSERTGSRCWIQFHFDH